MGHHQHLRAVGRGGEFARRDRSAWTIATLAGARCGKASRRGSIQRVLNGSGAESQDKRASDMAGAEQIEPGFARRRNVRASRRRAGLRFRRPAHRRQATQGSSAASRPSGALRASATNGPARSAAASAAKFGGVARIESLDQPMHAAAAALREIGPERDGAPQRRAAARRQAPARAASSASHSSAPPPIVPLKAPDGRTTMRAPLSRGLDPSTLTRLISAPAPSASSASTRRLKTA